jgi:hypothetical protein
VFAYWSGWLHRPLKFGNQDFPLSRPGCAPGTLMNGIVQQRASVRSTGINHFMHKYYSLWLTVAHATATVRSRSMVGLKPSQLAKGMLGCGEWYNPGSETCVVSYRYWASSKPEFRLAAACFGARNISFLRMRAATLLPEHSQIWQQRPRPDITGQPHISHSFFPFFVAQARTCLPCSLFFSAASPRRTALPSKNGQQPLHKVHL